MPKTLVKKLLPIASLMMMIGIAQAQITLSGISPSSGQAGITNVYITCNGFPTGTPASAANVQITLTPVGSGSPVVIAPTRVITMGGQFRRLVFTLPDPPPLSQISYNVSVSDPTDGLSSGNSLPFTENPAPAIGLAPASGNQGATVNVGITGTFTNFLQGSTQANFNGTDITVNSVTVSSPTSATANITISPSAATGARSITVSSGIQSANANFTVNAVVVTHNVSGNVKLLNGNPLAGASLSLGGALTATTDSSGNFTIPNVSPGSYTLTPSFTMPSVNDSVVFYPANMSVAVSSSDVTGQNFGAQQGFTVSGSVSYHGTKSKSGQVYVKLQLPNCAGCPTQGTSVELISRGATPVTVAFTIHGVPPGSYTGQAFYDLAGFDMQNIADPAAPSAPVVVTTNDVSGIAFPMTDPATTGNVSPATPDVPLNAVVSPIANGVAIYYPSVKIGGVEQALGYNVNWSNVSPTDCQSPSPSIGGGLSVAKNSTLWEDTGNVVFLDGNNTSNPFQTLSTGKKPALGQTWFFCVQGVNGAGVGGTWYTVNGTANTAAQVVLAAAPSTNAAGSSEVTVNVTLPVSTPFTGAGVNLSGPLYTGCYDRGTHNFNVQSVQNSTLVLTQPSGSPTPFNVFSVANGTNCTPFAWVDQDNDGVALANQPYAATAVPYAQSGDLFNLGRSNTVVPISAATSASVDLTGDSEQSVAGMNTQSFASFTDQNSVVQPQSYAVNFSVNPLLAQPGTVQLQSPSNNLNSLMDFAAINHGMFNMSLSTSTVQPQTTDSYILLATPLNTGLTPDRWGDTGATATCLGAACPLQVTGVNTSFATGLSATSGTTPTFSWGDGAGLVTQFQITDTNGNVIWQVVNIPSSTTSLTWPTDPTGAGHNAPTPTLASGTYIWSITTVDSNGNLGTQKMVSTF